MALHAVYSLESGEFLGPQFPHLRDVVTTFLAMPHVQIHQNDKPSRPGKDFAKYHIVFTEYFITLIMIIFQGISLAHFMIKGDSESLKISVL